MGKRPGNPSTTTARSGSDGVGRRLPRRPHVWLLVAALLVVAGMTSAVLAADSVARRDSEKSRQAFRESAGEISSTLKLAIQHENDLVVNAGAFVGNSNLSNPDLARWATSARVRARYPELKALGYIVMVPAADLPAFTARLVADPTSRLAADGTFQLVPPGDRPFYCLAPAGQPRFSVNVTPAGVDYCATAVVGPLVLAARDSGLGAYLPLELGNDTALAIETPIYADGAVPATVEARRAAFTAWVGTVVDPKVVLNRALLGHPGTAVTFGYHAGSSHAVFRGGKAPHDAQSIAIDLHNGWTMRAFASVPTHGVFGNGTALALLIAGVVLSLLLGALVFVLGTGRVRALRLVGEKTGELRYQALHDALTGLPNRALIMDRMEQLLVRSRRSGTLGAALFVDLDDFKNVNDTLGHEAGDRLLVAMAARLESTLRDADTIGRMGGDEFVVLIDGASLDVAPELVAERLLDVMRQPFDVDGSVLPLVVNTSIGIAVGDRASPGELLRDADVALYQAKAAGKNRYEIFHPEMQTEISHRIELEFDLRAALEGDQFRLVYQPIYNLDDLTLIGVEALLRWDHPTRGTVEPDEFIPILEQNGQIREVGRWVLREACTQMAAWHARGDTLDVSVNVSGRQLDDDVVVAHIRDALDVSGLDATALIIEVTETALMRNAEKTAQRLRAIKELGVRIAVDDFGTGYSSLAYLQQFPVDCLKIDRSFTSAISTSPESRALIGTLVQLGKDLGLKTLAEGVETTAEMDQLRAEHVNEAQGFLLARPLDPEALEAQLLAPRRPPAASSDAGSRKMNDAANRRP
jgi:diguanylate cyclase (GGDEF)-like protein